MQTKWEKPNSFHATQNITIWTSGGTKLSEGLSLTPPSRSLFISCHQKLSSLLLFWEPSGPTLVSVSPCVCVSGRKTPLIRCHVVLEAVTCQGSSRYLSVTTSLFSVCGWFGTLHLNTHICCSSVAWTTERSTIKMTPIVKYNKIQRCFRSSLTLGLDGQTAILNNYHIAKEPERVILHHITNTHA